MQILNYLSIKEKDQQYWRAQIRKSDWRAAEYLCSILEEKKLSECFGESTELLLLIEGDALISFCTYAEKDEIDDPSITPWVGFVYTFPEYRGQRRVGKLLEHTYALAKKQDHKAIYISSDEEGLYEKYGFTFWKKMTTIRGEETSVYRMPIVNMDYSDILGKQVKGSIDRPLGSAHPRHPEMVYPINYGYVDGVLGGDGAEQDVYVFGIEKPIRTYTGKVVGVIHRLNDNEDKWIVSIDGSKIPREEILKRTEFQEQYFMSELYL